MGTEENRNSKFYRHVLRGYSCINSQAEQRAILYRKNSARHETQSFENVNPATGSTSTSYTLSTIHLFPKPISPQFSGNYKALSQFWYYVEMSL